jgi:uncharacterized protein involved in outer membrane biogenesis
MSRLARLRRLLVRASLFALALAAVLLAGLRLYLRTPGVRAMVQREITAAVGAPAEVGSAEVALWGDSSVGRLRLLDAADGRPLLTAGRATADLSVLGWLRGRTSPRTIVLQDAEVRLRFDADGNLLTRLPAPPAGGETPALLVRGGALTLEQQGRAPFTLHQIDLALRQDTLTGAVHDPAWGQFDVTGRIDPDGRASLTLAGAGARLTPALLRSLPVVPPALWSTVEADGPAVPLTFSLALAPTPPLVRYRLAFDRARLTLPQPDRDPLRVGPVQGVLAGDETGFHLDATARDPSWGDWTARVGLVAATGAVAIDLHTPEAVVDQDKLSRLPYVPKNVWRQVQAAGRTPVRVHVGLFARKPGVHYRVELEPKDTRVRVSAISLDATHAAGVVVVEDGRVLLRKVTGRAAGGDVAVDADMDFRGEPSRLAFDLDVRRLVLAELPRQWELPRQVEGKLTGQAHLVVTVGDGPAQTHGAGKGRIDDVKLVGYPARQPIELRLEADGKAFHFIPRSPLLNILLHMTTLQPAPEPPAKPPQYLDADVKLDDVDLNEMLTRLGVKLPVELAGRLSFQVKLGIPINSARDVKAYRLRGSATLSTVRAAGLTLGRVKADLDYADGLLRLQNLSGELPARRGAPGTFAGTARVQVQPAGEAAVDLTLHDLPVAPFVRLVPRLPGPVSGRASGTLRAAVPLGRARDPAAWGGAVRLRSPAVEAFGLTFRDIVAAAAVAGGQATLSDLRGELAGAPFTGSASLSLGGKQPFQAELGLRGLDAGRLAPAGFPRLRATGGASASARVRGTLNPFTADGAGNLRAGPLRVAGLQVGRVALSWTLADGLLKTDDLDLAGAGGTLTGRLQADLTARKPSRLDLAVKDVDLHALAAAYPGLPFRVSGRVSGTAEGTYRPAEKGAAGRWDGEVDLSAPTLKVQDVPAQKLRGRLEYRGGQAAYHLDGETLGGKLTIEGKLPPAPTPPGRSDGRLLLERVRLARLWGPLGLRGPLGPLHGVLTVDVPFRHVAGSLLPVGDGRFELRALRWQGGELSDGVRGDVRLTAGGLALRNVNANLAGGELRGGLSYDWHDPSRRRFSLTLSQAEAARLLAFDRDTAGRGVVQGPIDLHLRGVLGGEWRGSGVLDLSRGKVLGVEVAEWRVPLDFSFSPRRGRGELAVRESTAQIGHGRALLGASLAWGGLTRVEGRLRLIDASLRSLGGMLGDVSSYAQGRVSGDVDFGGGEVRSVNDLTATVRATLKEAQAMQLPVLSQLTPFLLPGQAATTFTTGELKARLAGGVWRVEQLTLENTLAQLIFQGTVSLQGRLDLDVLARSSSLGGLNPLLLRGLLTRIPAVGPVPVGLLLQATEALSNRVLRLHVGGTTKQPQVQATSLLLLSEEAVRFFLTRSLIPAR